MYIILLKMHRKNFLLSTLVFYKRGKEFGARQQRAVNIKVSEYLFSEPVRVKRLAWLAAQPPRHRRQSQSASPPCRLPLISIFEPNTQAALK